LRGACGWEYRLIDVPGEHPEDEDEEPTGARRCAWCGRIELDGRWLLPADVPPTVERGRHSICPACFEDVLEGR
jgi:hypothetical protein